jgi:hypothetical protein
MSSDALLSNEATCRLESALRAIAALPESHPLLVPLHSNRALTCLKIGDYSGAADDATVVLDIIGLGYHPSRELKVSRADEGASVGLAEGSLKALNRRAEAFEL